MWNPQVSFTPWLGSASSSFSSCNFLMKISIFCLTFTLFFLHISTLYLYPFWISLFLSNSSYNTAFSFSLATNLFFKVFSSKDKFPIFKFTIAMVWNNSTVFFIFIISASTSSTNFGVFVRVVGSPNLFINDVNSCTTPVQIRMGIPL